MTEKTIRAEVALEELCRQVGAWMLEWGSRLGRQSAEFAAAAKDPLDPERGVMRTTGRRSLKRNSRGQVFVSDLERAPDGSLGRYRFQASLAASDESRAVVEAAVDAEGEMSCRVVAEGAPEPAQRAAMAGFKGRFRCALVETDERMGDEADRIRERLERALAAAEDTGPDDGAEEAEEADVAEEAEDDEGADDAPEAPSAVEVELLKDQVRTLRSKNEAVERERDEAQRELHRVRGAFAALRASVTGPAEPAAPEALPEEFPRTLSSALEWSLALWPDRVRADEAAWGPAESYRASDLAEVMRVLWSLGTLWDLRYGSGTDGRSVEEALFDRTGVEYCPGECRQTKESKRMAAPRTLTDGSGLVAWAHLKGRGRERDFRVYVAFDDESRRVVVRHAGRHLESFMDRHL